MGDDKMAGGKRFGLRLVDPHGIDNQTWLSVKYETGNVPVPSLTNKTDFALRFANAPAAEAYRRDMRVRLSIQFWPELFVVADLDTGESILPGDPRLKSPEPSKVDDPVAQAAHQWKAGDRARVKKGVPFAHRSYPSFTLETGQEMQISETSDPQWCDALLSPTDKFPISVRTDILEPIPSEPSPAMPSIDTADTPYNFTLTPFLADFLVTAINDGKVANNEGQTEDVAVAFGRIEGVLASLGLTGLVDDEEGD